MLHNLKIKPIHFRAVVLGDKKAELRVNDRDYKVGDVLVLKEYTEEGYSGNLEYRRVTDITDVSEYTNTPNLVMLSMEEGI